LEVFGDGQHSRDFTYIDTVIDTLVSAMLEKVNYPGPINLAFGEKIFLNEVIGILNARFPSLQVMYKEERFGDIRESQNSPELIRSLFPRINPKPFQIAMNETIDWLIETGASVANGPIVAD
jgi:UDP-glucose 4-epimerase